VIRRHWAPQSGSGGGHPAREGGQTDRRGARELVDGRTEPGLARAPDVQTLKGRRDRAILALLLGCSLRRGEVAGLRMEHLQQREEHWVIADLVGKAAIFARSRRRTG
jgi:integrase